MLPILSMLFRAKNLILISFIVVFVIVLILLVIRPTKYEAHMTFLVRNERAEPLVGSDPHQNTMQLPDVTEVNLNSEVELLSSAEVLRQVVINRNLMRGSHKDQAASVESAVLDLSKALKIVPVRNSSLINVSYQSTDQEQARSILAELASVYMQKRLNLHTVSQASNFFETESRSAQDNLSGAELERATFLSQNGYEGLPQQIQLGLQYVQELSSQVDGLNASLEETDGRIHQITMEREATQQRIPTQQRVASNPIGVQQLLSTIVSLENRKTELLTKFNSNDRLIAQTDQELKNTQEALTKVETMRPQENVSDANPAWLALDEEANKLDQTRTGLLSRKLQLLSQLKEHQDRLQKMEIDSVKANDLERKVKVMSDKFDLYETKAVAAKIGDGLDARNISNVILVSQPVVPALPEGSHLNLGTGCLFALFTSVSLGLFTQMMSEKLYGPADIEGETGIPVVATIPDGPGIFGAVPVR